VSLIEIATFIGALGGWGSFGFLVLKRRTEKARLEFRLESSYHCPPYDKNDNFHSFNVSFIATNKGIRNTTLYSANLVFEFEGKKIHPESNTTKTQNIEGDCSKKIFLHFTVNKEEFSKNITIQDAVLELEHTHKTDKIDIPKIRPNYN